MSFEQRVFEINQAMENLATFKSEIEQRLQQCMDNEIGPSISMEDLETIDFREPSYSDEDSLGAIIPLNEPIKRKVSYVKPDLPGGFESGSIKLARDFYEYFVFSQVSKNREVQENLRNLLFACSTKEKLKEFFISGKKNEVWITRKNKKISRHFNQVLYVLCNYFKVCKVVNHEKIIWTRVTKQNKNYIVDEEFIELLMDFSETKMELSLIYNQEI